MYNDPDLPHVRADHDDAGLDLETAQATDMTPRFGRLALCVAAASALAFGVVGTVAYGVWFNSDQQTYAEAIARARQALRMPAPNHAPAMLATAPEGTSSPPATAAQTVPATAAATTGPLPMPVPGALARSPGLATSSPADAIALLDLPASPAQSSAAAVDERRKPSTWAGEISRPQEETVLADDAADAPAHDGSGEPRRRIALGAICTSPSTTDDARLPAVPQAAPYTTSYVAGSTPLRRKGS